MWLDRRALTWSLVLLGSIIAAPRSRAEEEPKIEGELRTGIQYYADTDNRDSAKFLEYRDVPNGFVAEQLRFAWRPRECWYFDVDAHDVSQNDQRIGVEYGKRDVWRDRALEREPAPVDRPGLPALCTSWWRGLHSGRRPPVRGRGGAAERRHDAGRRLLGRGDQGGHHPQRDPPIGPRGRRGP